MPFADVGFRLAFSARTGQGARMNAVAALQNAAAVVLPPADKAP